LPVKGLVKDSQYVFRVFARSEIGLSEPTESEPFTAKHMFTVPGRPAAPEVTGTDKKSAALKWTPPESDGGSPITNYIIEYRPKGSFNWTKANDSTVPDTTFSVTGLREKSEYQFRISAENRAGVGEPSEPTKPVLVEEPIDVPSEPRKFQPTEVTKSSVTLTWVPPENDGGSPVTGYLIEKKTKTSPRWTKCNKSPVRDTIYTVTDLIENDDYEFRIMAENAAGAGKATQAIGPIKAKDPFAAPHLEFDNKFRDVVKLQSGATLKIPVKYSGIPTPTITWSKEEKVLKTSGRVTVDVKDTTTTLTIKKIGVEDDGLYILKAVNDAGEISSKFDVAVIDVPGKPEGPITVEDVQRNAVTLSWKPPKDDGGVDIRSYIIERKEAKRTMWTKAGSVNGETLTFTPTGLLEGTEYYFRISAENEVGISEPLAMDSPVTPKSPFAAPSAPIGPLEVTDIQRDNATIAWKAPEDDGGSPITGYIIEKRDTKRNNWSKVGKAPAGSTEYNVPGLIEGTSYYFRVIAENKAGQSDPLETEKPVTAKSPFGKWNDSHNKSLCRPCLSNLCPYSRFD
ncbi:hypothetical protein LOTGIDRAFT_141663, partial [Lottia gigantea]